MQIRTVTIVRVIQSLMTRLFSMGFVLVVITSGCTGDTNSIAIQTPHFDTPQMSLPTRITEVTKPTSTIHVLATPTDYVDQPSMPPIEVVLGCEEEHESEILNFVSSGADYLVITREDDNTGSLWTLSIDDNQYIKLPDTEWAIFPGLNSELDRIVYSRFVNENEQLMLSSLDGQNAIVLIDQLEEGYNDARWYGANELALFRSLDYENKPRPLWPVQLLNIQNQGATTLATPPEDSRFAGIFLGPGNGIGVVVVDHPGNPMWGIYDVIQETMLASFTGQGDENAVWSPNGNYVAISGEDLIIIDMKQLDEVIEIDLSPEIDGIYYRGPLGWDHNSSMVAFAILPFGSHPEKEPQMGIYIYDMETGSIRHYCLDFGHAGSLNFFWSPSSRYVAWSNPDPAETQILDVENGELMSIPSVSIIGWGREKTTP